MSIDRKCRVLGLLALAAAAAGCASSQPSMLGIGGKSSFNDPNKSVFAPVPQRQQQQPRPPAVQAQGPGQPYVPAAAATGRPGSVTVQDGETITDIASRHRVGIMALMYENNLKDPNIFPGMVLKLPPRS